MSTAKNRGIELIERSDASYVTMWGEIDAALRDQAGQALAGALERDLPVILDTSGVTFVDSAGIAFLVQFYTIGAQEGLDVRLCDPPKVVSEVLDMLGIEKTLAPRNASGKILV